MDAAPTRAGDVEEVRIGPSVEARPDISLRAFVMGLVVVAIVAAVLRLVFPLADPPWRVTSGIVWHDEGAWVHNARNRALFGAWRLDEWNPLFIAPVFTLLEYGSFASFGVGVWQARLVSEVTGWLSVLLLGLGVARLATRRAGLAAAALLATNYVYVMYNRAALMEASMVAFLVASWYAFVRAFDRPWLGFVAGVLALAAYFTKASAVFYVAALGVVSLAALCDPIDSREPLRRRFVWPGRAGALTPAQRAGLLTLVGLASGSFVALALFVAPYWPEYRFYNWVMSVTRKPTYDLQSLVDRASWFPIVHDFFTRMWLVALVAIMALLGAAGRWRGLARAELLLHIWILLGAAELVLHDTGNERRMVFLIPPMVALASLVLLRDRRLVVDPAVGGRRRGWLLVPGVLFGAYMGWGAIARLPFLYEIRPGVRVAAALAVASTVALYATWPRLQRWLARESWSPAQAALVVALVLVGDAGQFVQWSLGRSYSNYDASVELGRRLPAGTLVHGKLANGLALENRIRPIFVGRGFGNYADRFTRDDIRYILTYTAPRLGYEGPVIREVVEAYPDRRTIWTFDVRETTSGMDRAALIEKQPPSPSASATRARD